VTFKQTLKYFESDIRERARVEKKTVTTATFLKIVFNPMLIVIANYRLQHWLYSNGLPVAAEFFHWLSVALFGVDIASAAVIGPEFVLYHANGIYIGGECELGRRVYIYHHSSLGVPPRPGAKKVEGKLVIEDNVVIACGARVMGAVVIGQRSFIAPNEGVTVNVPPRSFFLDGKVARSGSN